MGQVIVDNISKKFKKDPTSKSTLYKIISIITKRNSKEKFYVLKNVSLEAKEGEILGIVGENGSGKSTLLRAIAGIYNIDSGKIITKGKIISLIGLSTAMKGSLTMEDNIYLCGAFLEMSKKELKKRFNRIVEFSGLKEFVNTRLYKFSGGMIGRLIFSIAIHSDPEILLLDEVFEVGDEEFKNKSGNKIKELVRNGCTAILVGHTLENMEKQCSRMIWLDNGKIRMEGKPAEVVKAYKNSVS